MSTVSTARDEPTLDALRHHLKEHAKHDAAHRRHVEQLVADAASQTASAGDVAPSSPADGAP